MCALPSDSPLATTAPAASPAAPPLLAAAPAPTAPPPPADRLAPGARPPPAVAAPAPAGGGEAGGGLDKSGRAIRDMFGAVARRYDLLNHLLSAGLDRWWRRRAAAAALELAPGPPGPSGSPGSGRSPGALVLDLCAGTG